VVDLYHGLLHGDDELIVHAYETWGFRKARANGVITCGSAEPADHPFTSKR
jgi:hypothetical protein